MSKKKMLRNGGEVMYNDLTKTRDHLERLSKEKDTDNGWNNHGFTICQDRYNHVVAQGNIAY